MLTHGLQFLYLQSGRRAWNPVTRGSQVETQGSGAGSEAHIRGGGGPGGQTATRKPRHCIVGARPCSLLSIRSAAPPRLSSTCFSTRVLDATVCEALGAGRCTRPAGDPHRPLVLALGSP